MPALLPETIFLGVTTSRSWIFHGFESESSAAFWLNDEDGGHRDRRLYRVRLTDVVEYERVPPVSATIQPKSLDQAAP